MGHDGFDVLVRQKVPLQRSGGQYWSVYGNTLGGYSASKPVCGIQKIMDCCMQIFLQPATHNFNTLVMTFVMFN